MHQRDSIPPKQLKIKVFSSITDVPRAEWNDLLKNHSCTQAQEFWQVIEQSGLNDFSYQYVLFYDENNTPIALASFYSVTTDIAIFASGKLKWLLDGIRRVFPHFLKLRMLECGTPITLNSPPLIIRDNYPAGAVTKALDELLLTTAKAQRQLLIIIRDFEADAEPLQADFVRLGYCFADGLPNSYMDITWQSADEYIASMKSYYRCKLLRHLRKTQELNIRHELVDDFSNLAELLCSQWMVVHHNADEFQREVLTPEFYREFSEKMGDRSKVLLFYQNDQLVGHVLLLMDGTLLRWLYFGRMASLNDSLYIYAGYKVIETAISLRAKRLEMGLTTYSIKQDLGGQVTPIKLALKSRFRIINPFIHFIYPLMNHIPTITNKDIFKRRPGLS